MVLSLALDLSHHRLIAGEPQLPITAIKTNISTGKIREIFKLYML